MKDILNEALEIVKQKDAQLELALPPMVKCATVLAEVRQWQQTGKLPTLFCQAHLQAVSQHTSPSGDPFWLVSFLIDRETCFVGNLLLTEQQGKLVPIVTEALVANGGQQA